MIRIVVDAMGSDEFPTPDVVGSVMAARAFGVAIILVGDEAKIRPVLAAQNPGGSPHPDRPCSGDADNGRQRHGARFESTPAKREKFHGCRD